MSKLDNCQKRVENRQANSSNQNNSDGPEILECPLCEQVMLSEGTLRNHVSQSEDPDHHGMRLDGSLEAVEKYKFENILRQEYLEKEKTQQEIANQWGIGRNTVYRWLNKHGIDRRKSSEADAWNRVNYATYYTETSDSGGYERVGAYNPEAGSMDWAKVHQLVAIAEGASPEKIFSNGDYHCHHVNGIPWDNRPENIEMLTREEHLREHGMMRELSTSQQMYGEWGHPDWNPEFSKAN